MISRSLGHRAPLLWLACPFMAGLVGGKWLEVAAPGILLTLAFVAVACAAFTALRCPRTWAASIVTGMTAAGLASYSLNRVRLPSWEQLPSREARLDLRVDRVFAPRQADQASGLATITHAEPHLHDLVGQRLYFSLNFRPPAAAPLRTAVISAVGILTTLPHSPPSDSFDGYLAAAGMNFRLTRGRIMATRQEPRSYHRFCARMLERFSAILEIGVDAKRPELAGVLRAMMLGQKQELSEEQGTLFIRSGTMHLFAISGLHIAMIAVAVHGVLSMLRVPRVPKYAAGLALLWLYVDITGAAPSAIRAFIMVAFVETALMLRVPTNPVSSLAGSALFVLLFWPMQIFSASFQMSYGIVAALLLLGLPLSDSWIERWSPFRLLPKPLWRRSHHALDWFYRQTVAAVAIGLATTLVGTISGISFFKLFTPGGLFANLVLIPPALFVIIAGFASLVSGLIGLSWLSGIFNHAAVLMLWGIDVGARTVVVIPGAWQIAEFRAPWIGPATLVVLLAVLAGGYAVRWERKYGGWWPPFAVVGLVMIFGVKFG